PPRSSGIRKGRKPRADCDIAPSPYRPHVAAVDRLRAWTSPHSTCLDSRLRLELSPGTANAVQHLLFTALEPSTLTTYGPGLLRFHQFCDSEGIPESSRMPASRYLLAGFVAHHAGAVSGGTLSGWLTGLHAWHDVNDAPWHGDSRFVSLVRTSASKHAPLSSRRAQRAPVTIEHLLALELFLSPDNPRDCAVLAVALVAFWGCCCLGELTVPSRSAFDRRRHVAMAPQPVFKALPCGVESALFTIPFGKVEKESGAHISLTGRNLLCPVRALRHHLDLNSRVPDNAPLFAYATADEGWMPMTKSAFLGRCKEAWDPLRLSRVSGHSFRIGGATELLLAGVPPETVAAQGRWRSLAFLLYWRRLEDLLPLTISKSYDRSRIATLKSDFDAYRVRNNLPSDIPDSLVA
ncbi:DNA breaking-rejoining enzyme, partial [Heliocybe sulcata]